MKKNPNPQPGPFRLFQPVFILLPLGLLLALFQLAACKPVEQRSEESQDEWTVAMLTVYYQETGNCAVTREVSDSTHVFSCIPLPAGFCDMEKLFDTEGNFITTENTAARILSRANDLADESSECEDISAALFVWPWVQADGEEDADSKREKIRTRVVESCEFDDAELTEEPLTARETRTLQTIDGRIAFAGAMADLDGCASPLVGEEMLETLRNLGKGERTVGTKCSFGDKALWGVRSCSEKEEALARSML